MMKASELKFSFTDMHEIAKKAYQVLKESSEVKLIDTVLDIEQNKDSMKLTTYEGIVIKTNTMNTLTLLNIENCSMNTNDVNEYINNVFEGLQKEVAKFKQDKVEFIKKHKGVTFDDVLKGYQF